MTSNIRRLTLTLAMLWIGHFCVDFMIGIWSIYKTIASLDLAMAGAIAGFCSCMGEGTQLLWGRLSDKGYFKWVILGGIVVSTCVIFLPYSSNYTYFLLLYLFTCIGSGAFHPSAVGLLGKLAGNRKTFVISIFAVGGSLGLAFSHFSFKDAYFYLEHHIWILAIPVILFAAIGCLHSFGMKSPEILNRQQSQHGFFEIFKYFKRRDLTLVYFVQMANQIFAWGMLFLLPDVLLSRGYEDWITYGGGHFFFVLGAGSLMAPAGYLADKFSSKSVLIYAYTLSIALFYTFWYFDQIETPYILILLFFMGATLGLLNPVCVAFGNKLDPNNPGMVSAFLMGMVWVVSEVIGPAGGGLLTKLFTEDAPANALAILCLAMCGGLALSFKLPSAAEENAQLEYSRS